MRTVQTSLLFAFAAFLVSALTGCPPSSPCQNPSDCVIAAKPNPPTPPNINMDAFFSSGKATISVTETTPPVSTKVGSGEVITMIAAGTDNDGGIQDIQIWVEKTTWIINPNGTETQEGPGLLGNPSAGNPDTTSKLGDQVLKKRIASFNVEDFKAPGNPANRKVRIRVWAVAINFAGDKSQSNPITFDWP